MLLLVYTKEELFFWRTGRRLATPSDRLEPAPEPKLPEDHLENQFVLVIDCSGGLAGVGVLDVSLELKPKVVFNALG